jgi:FkbM family methyltransferase
VSNKTKGRWGRLVNGVFHRFGLHFSRFPAVGLPETSLGAMLGRLANRQISINTVIDVGASNGCWSKEMMKVYPTADYFLIEANPLHQPDLESFIASNDNVEFTISAAGDRVGSVFFDDSDPIGGTASFEPSRTMNKTLPSTTIDVEIRDRALRGPFLLKLDTHGFELPILEGASESLKLCNILVIETYNFSLTGDCLMFWEMCAHLASLGFRPVDIVEPMFRPKDQVFWQIDIVFARDDRIEFSSNTYK